MVCVSWSMEREQNERESTGDVVGVLKEANVESNGNGSDDEDGDLNRSCEAQAQAQAQEGLNLTTGDGDGDGEDVISHEIVESGFPSNIPAAPANPNITKGYGLKKWRRIKRDFNKDGDASITNPSHESSIKILKRGQLSDIVVGDGSSSTSSTYRLPIAEPPVFAAGPAPAPDSSDNSDDRSSRSSTAASAPPNSSKHRFIRPMRTTGRNLSPIAANFIGPGSQAAAASVGDSSKKHRAQISIKLDNSDSRSCNSVFHGATDQPQLNSDDDDDPEPVAAEQLQAGCSNNGNLPEDNTCSAKHGNSNSHQLQGDADPLLNSIQMLHSAQAALEREVQSFGEMGKGIRFLCDESNEGDCLDGWSSKFNRVYLDKNVQTLERQLSEAENMLKEKELKIVALEATIKDLESCGRDTGSTIELQNKGCQDVEVELDSLLKQEIEAEVVYLAMTTSAKDLSALVKHQIRLLEDRESLAREQASSMRLLTDRDNKDFMLRGQTEQLKTLQQEVEGGGKNLKMRKGIANHAKCFLIQLIFLVLAFVLFVSRLLPKSTVVVPT